MASPIACCHELHLDPESKAFDICAARLNVFRLLDRSLCLPQADESYVHHTYLFEGVAKPMASAPLKIRLSLLGKGFQGF